MRHPCFLLSTVLTILVPISELAAAPIYDVATDFSISANPSGPWSYGMTSTLGSTFTAYAATSNVNGIDFWQATSGSNTTPNVGHNATANTITFASTTFAPGQVSLHPGPANEYSVIRFVAPLSGSYGLSTTFNMRSNSPFATNSTDVHVRLNGSSLFSGTVTGFNDSEVFSSLLNLAANDILDFAVGPNGTVPGQSYLGDTTAINARLEVNPRRVEEPGSLPLAAMSIAAFAFLRRRVNR